MGGLDSNADLSNRVIRKVAWRLIPFLCLLYVFNILDRGNVGFARLTMQSDLEMKDWVYDIGVGLFYLGYLLFEVPSNLLLRRMGARRWISRIMISWGLVSCLTMTVTGPWGFYFVRVLLGVAEAGFFPGIVLYLTYWFPARERARVIALFMAAIAFSGVVGNPLSGAILKYLDGTAGLTGWQWLFLLEGLPSLVLGIIVLFYLTDRPEQAGWLAGDERDWLTAHMSQEEKYRQQRHGVDRLLALVDGRVWLLIAVYFTVAVGSNAAGAYFPKLLDASFEELDKFQVGLLSALPHVCSLVGMVLFSAHSDRTGERRWHVAVAAFAAAAGWAVGAVASSEWGTTVLGAAAPWVFLAGLCLAQTGMMCMLPAFWTLPTAFLSGAAAAGGIALINSVANIGGALGPLILGQLGPWAPAAGLFAGSLLALCVRHDPTLDRAAPQTG
jgi:ACS family tartrate transporter-like MFS transporter